MNVRGYYYEACPPSSSPSFTEDLYSLDIDIHNGVIPAHAHLWKAATPYFLGDLDGNGDVDLIASEYGGSTWKYWLSNSSAPQFTLDKMATMTGPSGPLTTTDRDQQRYEYMAPLDGTGKTAFLFREGTTTAEIPNLVAVVANAKTGLVTSQETTLPVGPKLSLTSDPNCVPSMANLFCMPTIDYVPNAFHYLFIDLNGDGNADALQVPDEGGTPRVAFNSGSGFGPVVDLPGTVPATNPGSPPYSFPAISPDVKKNPPVPGVVKIADLNGDGLPDLLIANHSEATDSHNDPAGGPIVAYMSNGAQGLQIVALLNGNGQPIFQGGGDPVTDPGSGFTYQAPYGVDVLDFNGDGLPDVFASGKIWVHAGNKPDVLIAVHDGLGKDTSIQYAPVGGSAVVALLNGNGGGPPGAAPVYTPATDCQYPLSCVKSGIWVVSGYTVTGDWGTSGKPPTPDTNGNISSFGFQYIGGRSDVGGRGWLGFDQQSVFDYRAHTTTTTYYNDPGTDTGYGYPMAGLPQKVVTSGSFVSGASTPSRVQTTTTSYLSVQPLGKRCATPQPFAIGTVVSDAATTPGGPETILRDTSTIFTYDTFNHTFNNLTSRTTKWATSGETSVWSASYDQNVANGKWLLSLPKRIDETSTVPGQPSVTRTTVLDTDPMTGLLNDETIEPNGGPTLMQHVGYERNVFGQVTHVVMSAQDPLNTSQALLRESWVSFDAFDSIFPASVTNSLGHTTRMVYHPGLGVLAFAEDPNGVTMHAQYDGFGRPVTRAVDGQGKTTFTYGPGHPYYEGGASNVPGLFSVEVEQAGGGKSLVTYNALGDEVARGVRNHDNTFSYTETTYTLIPGQVGTVSRPHPYQTTPPQFVTSLAYDGLGRTTLTTLPDGNTVSTSYNGLATTVTDPRHYARTTVTDDQGRPTSVDEDSQLRATYPPYDPTHPYVRPGTAVSVSYTYGPFGVPIDVSAIASDANEGIVTKLAAMQYDDLGRRTSLLDADSGQTVTTYDALGETTSEADATGQVHIPTRDALGRIVADYSTQDGTSYFQYDTAPNGIGKLDTSTSPDQVTTAYAYDGAGRNVRTTWQIQGSPYTVRREFDSVGRVSAITYPFTPGLIDHPSFLRVNF